MQFNRFLRYHIYLSEIQSRVGGAFSDYNTQAFFFSNTASTATRPNLSTLEVPPC